MNLSDSARGLLDEALRVYAELPRAAAWLREHRARFDGPLRVAVAGPPQSGRSTLIEAIGGSRPARSLRGLELDEVPAADEQDVARAATGHDALLYLMRTGQGRDVALLRPAFDHPVADRAPTGVIAVLSRADELGAGRIDALTSARQIARRSRRDGELATMCLTVVAVAGLLGHAGPTLTDEEFAALGVMATVSRGDLEPYLLSTDRFGAGGFPVPLEPAVRRALLERLGIFGVRLTTTLIRTGVDGRAALATELTQRSGVRELRDALRLYFADRADDLKARSALIAVDTVLRADPVPASRPLRAELERVLAGAHQFRELRLLASLHGGLVELPGELGEQAQRLIGGFGPSTMERLGFEREPLDTVLRHTVLDTLAEWQSYAVSDELDEPARQAARVVVRSCEGMLAQVV